MSGRPPRLTVRLDHALAAAAEAELRAMAEVGSRLALSLNGLAEPEVGAAVQALVDGRFGDSEERRALKALVERLDEAAFDLGDAVEEGDASEAEYASAFMTARAATSLCDALEADAGRAAERSLYEALHAVDDQDAIERAVLNAVEVPRS